MPRMDGGEFYQRLQQEKPALAERVLFLSGDITHLAGAAWRRSRATVCS